jgi:hypothetical protein
MNHHIGDGYGNWEDLDFFNDHRLAGIRPYSFDDFAVIFYFAKKSKNKISIEFFESTGTLKDIPVPIKRTS